MADYLLYMFLVVWSVWGVIHCVKRLGLQGINVSDETIRFDKGKGYEIKNKQKKIMVLFAEGPIVWAAKFVEVLWIVIATVTKFVLVVPFKALDKWAQEEDKEDKKSKKVEPDSNGQIINND